MARVFVIGATSAIAAEMARIYAARGDALYLLARDAERLARLAGELGTCVRGHHAADLDETQRAAEHVQRALESLGGFDTVVIAHGWLGDQLRTEVDVGEAEAVLLTNFGSAVALLIPIARIFEDQSADRSGPARAGTGHIAVLSSVAGDRGRPRNYTYGAAKGGLNVYLQGLRSRLHPTGTAVHTLKLGPVDTPMTVDHAKNAAFASPGSVARKAVAAIDRGAAEAYIPGFWRVVMFVVRCLPETLFQRLAFLSER